ncbi:transposase family protein [Bradyrhizobium sp. USDA 4451]
MARPKAAVSLCPCCSNQTHRVHSHYTRRLADLPWQGQLVEIRLQARRFRCANPRCLRRIFTERLPTTVRPRARRTIRLGESQLAIGFAVGGEPGSRLSHKLAMPVAAIPCSGWFTRRPYRILLLRLSSASTIGLGVVASDMERSSAIWSAIACSTCFRIVTPAVLLAG